MADARPYSAVALYAGAAAFAAVGLWLWPAADLWLSGLFFAPGRGFVLRDWWPVVLVYRLVPWLAWGIAVLVAMAALWLFLVRRPLWRFDRKALLFIAFSIALGPGLIANTVLKDHWGRARPTTVEAFGGPRHFTPAPLPATQCARNCAFVSGHAALGFSLVAFAFLVPPGRGQRRAIAAAAGFGALVGLVRIAQGGHFLSDVVWAELVVFAVTAFCHWSIVERDVFAAAPAVSFYTAAGRTARAGMARLRMSPAARTAAATLLTALLVALSIAYLDRPAALWAHHEPGGVKAPFLAVTMLGEAWGWLLVFAVGFAALHWGGALPGLRPWAGPMRAASGVPAFLFAAIVVAGLAADVIKIALGRMRPKLLFDGALYGFTGVSWRPDHWSFPSGHTATFVALAAALWWLWPRHILFYIAIAALVAASRIVVGAHYPSDVIAAGFIAVLTTWGVAVGFARGGIDLAAAARGRPGLAALPPWPCRRWRATPARAAAPACTPSLASPPSGVVSPDHGSAHRDV